MHIVPQWYIMREIFSEVTEMGAEYERKFRATPEILSAIAAAYTGASRSILMETTYYDTPSHALSERRYTLRRRLENGISVCTLKTPGTEARGEWETECDSIEKAVPLLLAMGCPAELETLAREGLVPICGARFTRLAKTVILPGGTVELALDQGVLIGGSREIPLCEVEVELKSGETAVCDSFAAELAARFGLLPEEKSKFARACAR